MTAGIETVPLAAASDATVSLLVRGQIHAGLAHDARRRAARYTGQLAAYWEDQAIDHSFAALTALISL